MIPGRKYTAEDVPRLVRRRKWHMLLPLVLGTTAAIVVSSRLPDRYRAETLILIVPQSVPQEYVRATVTTEIRDRLPSISQQILSRSRLEPIIKEFDLYQDALSKLPLEAVVERMRRDIHVEIVQGVEEERSDSFRVSYESADPLLAMQVTERLAGLFIEENLRDRKVMAQETSSFLESQLVEARLRLVEREKRLEAYRLQHGSELPAQLQSNLQAMQSVQLQIQALNDAISRDRDRRLINQRQLADLRSEQFLAEPGVAAVGLALQTPSASAQLEATLAELEALGSHLTPEHPDIARVKERISDLERKVEAEAAGTLRAEVRSRALTASEIAKRNRIRELEAEMESLDRQVASKVAEEAQLRAKLDTYQSRVEAVPTRESELASLTRDYDTLQDLYRGLLTKREDSKIAENLEQGQVGEQFKVLDPPRRPERPFSPNRPLIDLVGAVLGLGLGVGLVALLELRDKTLQVEADVRAALALPLLALIPAMTSAAQRRSRRWRQVCLAFGLTVVMCACGAAVWLTFRI